MKEWKIEEKKKMYETNTYKTYSYISYLNLRNFCIFQYKNII